MATSMTTWVTKHYDYTDPAFLPALRTALESTVKVRSSTDWVQVSDEGDEGEVFDGVSFLTAEGYEVAQLREYGAYITAPHTAA